LSLPFYRLAVPRTIFFTLRFAEPRGTARLAFAGAFLRAARLDFLRSSLLRDFVFAIEFLCDEFAISEFWKELYETVILRPIVGRRTSRNVSDLLLCLGFSTEILVEKPQHSI